MDLLKKDIIFSEVTNLKGVGKQLSKYGADVVEFRANVIVGG